MLLLERDKPAYGRVRREDRARTPSGAASRVEGGQSVHVHPSTPDHSMGKARWRSRPPRAFRLGRLSLSRRDREAAL